MYQLLVDRFVPSANLAATRLLYPAPKVLRDWLETTKPGLIFGADICKVFAQGSITFKRWVLPCCTSSLYILHTQTTNTTRLIFKKYCLTMRWDLMNENNAEYKWMEQLIALQNQNRVRRIGNFRVIESDKLIAFKLH